MQEIAADDDTAVVILTGAGRAFCAGNDIKQMRETGPDNRRADILHEIDTASTIEHLPQPVIAAVNGYCFTAGLEILLVCDIVLAAESAKIGDTHAQWGLVPGNGGPQRLSRRIGLAQAKEMLFSSRHYSAAECVALGLVNRVSPDDRLMGGYPRPGHADRGQQSRLHRRAEAHDHRHRALRPLRRHPHDGSVAASAHVRRRATAGKLQTRLTRAGRPRPRAR